MIARLETSEQRLLFDPKELDSTDPGLGTFRPIHYLGSKLRLIESLSQIIEDRTRGGAVCDLFAGSGTLSAALSRKHPVIAVDIQEYSRVICSAILRAESPTKGQVAEVVRAAAVASVRSALLWALEPLLELERAYLGEAAMGAPEGLYDIIEHGSVITEQLGRSRPEHSELGRALRVAVSRLKKRDLAAHPDSTVTRYFGGIYYSYAQAIELDCILSSVHSVQGVTKDRFLAAALGAASDTVNTVGRQFAQPIRPRSASGAPKKHLIQKTIRDRSLNVMDAFKGWADRYQALPPPINQNKVWRADFREALADPNLQCDVVYADPPYTRDHYSRYYHALETMCLRDNPGVSTAQIGKNTVLSRGLYRAERHQSPFCIKSQAPAAFDELCKGVSRKGAALVLSYSPFNVENGERPRVTSLEVITGIAERYFKSVEIVSPGRIAHSKLTSSDMTVDTTSEAEQVVICRDPIA